MSDEDGNENGGTKSRILPYRYFVAIMGSIGLAISYGFKVNVSVAIVAMVNHTAVKNLSLNNAPGASSSSAVVCEDEAGIVKEPEDGPFVWNELLQGYILSAYFWGYMISLLPGGRMSELISARWVMNGSILINVVGSIFSPICAEIHYSLLILMRFIQGLGGGVTFPAMHIMVSKWAPPAERNVIASIVYAGTALGTVISILLSGLLAATMGWIWIFYLEGLLSLIWCAVWWLMIEDSPKEQKKFITDKEREYIVKALGTKSVGSAKKLKFPLRDVLKSAPFWAILVSHVCSNTGWYMLLIELPTFMNQILKFDMSSNAGLSALPFFCMWILTMSLSKILSLMHDRKWITVTQSRKIGTIVASAVPALCLLAVSYTGCNRTAAVALMTVGIASIGGMYCGFLSNHIDIAPNFAGTLVAMTNTIGTVPGFLVPILVGKLTHGNQTIEAWRVVFFITIGLYIIEIVTFTIFGSGEEQPWNTKGQNDEEDGQTVPLKGRSQ